MTPSQPRPRRRPSQQRRAGTHIRNGIITGTPERLNQKAIKVLSVIKFAKSSMTREELMRDASMSQEDVNRQVALLLTAGLIKNNSRFPAFPTTGWHVFTEFNKHTQIIQTLREHDFWDKPSLDTKEFLASHGKPYPTGMILEGTGIQTDPIGLSYPGDHFLINEDLDYKPEAYAVMKEFRDEKKPFRPKEYSDEAITERFEKYKWLNEKLSAVYGIPVPELSLDRASFTEENWNKRGASTSSNLSANNRITLIGKFSAITFLHEYGHARGFNETSTILWSTNLFKRIFPVSFSKLVGDGSSHVLMQPDTSERRFEL